MKKFMPLLVSGVLLVGAFACQDTTNTTTETPKTNTETSQTAKPATQKTTTTAKSPIATELEKKIPGSKLEVEDKAGAVTVKGTVPTAADIKKIEPIVKQQKGVKTVKLDVKAAPKKAQ
jgi:hyperosmotically inducible periplasmic protein